MIFSTQLSRISAKHSQGDNQIDAEVAKTQRKAQPLENKNEAHTAVDTVDTRTVDFEQAATLLGTDDSQASNDTETLPLDETSEGLDMTDAFLPDDFVSEEETAEVPISPFGFGPYPEVPMVSREQGIGHRLPPQTADFAGVRAIWFSVFCCFDRIRRDSEMAQPPCPLL